MLPVALQWLKCSACLSTRGIGELRPALSVVLRTWSWCPWTVGSRWRRRLRPGATAPPCPPAGQNSSERAWLAPTAAVGPLGWRPIEPDLRYWGVGDAAGGQALFHAASERRMRARGLAVVHRRRVRSRSQVARLGAIALMGADATGTVLPARTRSGGRDHDGIAETHGFQFRAAEAMAKLRTTETCAFTRLPDWPTANRCGGRTRAGYERPVDSSWMSWRRARRHCACGTRSQGGSTEHRRASSATNGTPTIEDFVAG